MARVTPLARAQRARLLTLEQRVATHIGAAWTTAQGHMDPDVQAFLRAYAAELARMRDTQDDASATVPPLWLHTSGQLGQMQRRTHSDVGAFAVSSLMALTHGQHSAIVQGADDASALLTAAIDIGVTYAPRRANGNVLAELLGKSNTTGNPLSDLLGRLDDASAATVVKTLHTALSTGAHPRVAARMIAQSTDMAYKRALVISRTEMLGAYRSSAIATYHANADVCKGWRWLAAPGCCAFCASMDGTEHGLDEAFDTHPNCRCTPTPITKSVQEIIDALAA